MRFYWLPIDSSSKLCTGAIFVTRVSSIICFSDASVCSLKILYACTSGSDGQIWMPELVNQKSQSVALTLLARINGGGLN